jgi:uncharacterized membrane protein
MSDQTDAQNAPAVTPGVISKHRLEFLYDGVFAIAMTILVLELKVPELASRRSVPELRAALIHHAPTFASYLLSFGMLGLLWYRHNQLYRHIRFITRPIFALHLLQLATAAFFPFCAATIGRYPVNALAQSLYVGCVAVYVWSSFFMYLVAHAAGAIDPVTGPEGYRREYRRTLRGAVLITATFLLGVSGFLAR